jgi:hypothetical protein
VQRVLQHVFGQLEIVKAEKTRQNSDHPSRLMPEKMVDQLL